MSQYRDHLLFLAAGVLVGFVLAYLAFEEIGSKQAPRLEPGQVEASTVPPSSGLPGPQANPGAGNPGAGNPGSNAGTAFTQEQVQQLRAYVAENPDDAGAVLQLANMNFDIRNWPRAAELYERRIALQPGEADVVSDLGICYREMGELDKALEAFDEAQKINPQHWESRFNEVVVLAIDLKRFDDAEAVLDELRVIRPGNQDVERLAAEVERRKNAA